MVGHRGPKRHLARSSMPATKSPPPGLVLSFGQMKPALGARERAGARIRTMSTEGPTSARSVAWRTVVAAVMILAIAIVDWQVQFDVAFGFLYVFPVILAGTVLRRWQIALVATLCTAMADLFDPYPFSAVSVPNDILV